MARVTPQCPPAHPIAELARQARCEAEDANRLPVGICIAGWLLVSAAIWLGGLALCGL